MTFYEDGTFEHEAKKPGNAGDLESTRLRMFQSNSSQSSSKRRKVSAGISKHPATKGKERATDKATIPIPTNLDEDEGDVSLSDQDLNLLEEYGDAVGFLDSLDHKSISR